MTTFSYPQFLLKWVKLHHVNVDFFSFVYLLFKTSDIAEEKTEFHVAFNDSLLQNFM